MTVSCFKKRNRGIRGEDETQRLRSADRKTLAVVFLIAVSGIIISYFGGLGWAPTRANLALQIMNETDQPLSNVTNPMYLTLPSRFNFTTLPENTTSITFARVQGSLPQVTNYWRQLQLEIVYIAPHSTVSINLQEIYPTAVDYSDLTEEDVGALLSSVPTNVSFSLQFIILRDTPIGTLSIGSYYYSQSKSGIQTPPAGLRERIYVHLLYYALAAVVITTLLGIPLSSKSEPLRRRYPFTTFLIAGASLFIYVFVGSGLEVNTLLNLPQSGLHFLPILDPLAHASYTHITGNLPLFVIVGAASEWVACAGVANMKQNMPKFVVFFLLPPVVSSIGFGLSFVIEMMAVFLLTYAVVNRETIARSAWMAGIVFVSGLTLVVFYNWLTYAIQLVSSLLQGSTSVAFALTDYNTFAAIGHVSATILAAGIAGVLYSPRRSRQKGWRAKIHNFGYMAFKE